MSGLGQQGNDSWPPKKVAAGLQKPIGLLDNHHEIVMLISHFLMVLMFISPKLLSVQNSLSFHSILVDQERSKTWSYRSCPRDWLAGKISELVITLIRHQRYSHTFHVYVYTWKAIKTKFSVQTGLNIFLVRYVFFPNTAMSGCKPSTYRSIVFLKSWICRTGSDSMSVSSGDSIWGSMLTFVYCFFPTWCWKTTI